MGSMKNSHQQKALTSRVSKIVRPQTRLPSSRSRGGEVGEEEGGGVVGCALSLLPLLAILDMMVGGGASCGWIVEGACYGM